MILSGCIGGSGVAEFCFGGGFCHFEAENSGDAKSRSTAKLRVSLELFDNGCCESVSAVSMESVHTMMKVGDVSSVSSVLADSLVKRQGIGPAITFEGKNS
ncbi:hypothetical protein [Maridesulfovibrio ferrireducens]|uniref:hypothetical protein n=1 Tax=Maridesulfovibrio ferrireducens TaxID=246191 RepID=UPI001A31DFA2|nr:hypothetical protein [Maridesulfovibrio ferrireducens]MBI9110318.1 hypothetical protein [Maridesulfovibrio ferrireducens]